ncbi:MAG TPA: MFS transporter [Actinomycetes bacterium]|nr:MFS transporter [Actinomycetes bacterium]
MTSPAHSTPASTAGSPGILARQYRPVTFGILSFVLLFAFEGMGVATVMPLTVDELGGLPYYAWSFSGYLIASMYGMVVSGEMSDRRGPRPSFMLGVGLFVAGLLIGGAAESMLMFIVARAIQGVGGGMAIVALYVLVGRVYPDDIRPKMFAALAYAWIVPGLLGPFVAGWIAETWSWRWVFLGVPMFVIPVLFLLMPRLRGFEPDEEVPPRAQRKRLALAAAVGAGLLQYAGQQLRWYSLLIAAAAFALLVSSVPKLLPRGTLRFRRGIPTIVAMRGVLAGAFFGAESFVPLMLVRERGLSAQTAGLVLTGAAVSWSLGSWYQGQQHRRLRRDQLVPLGSALVAIAILSLTLVLIPAVPPLLAALAWATAAVGMGMSIASLSVLLFEQSPISEQGTNSAAIQVSDALGSIVFVGLAGAIFAATYSTAGKATFAAIYLVMAGLAIVGALLGGRVRPAGATREMSTVVAAAAQ